MVEAQRVVSFRLVFGDARGRGGASRQDPNQQSYGNGMFHAEDIRGWARDIQYPALKNPMISDNQATILFNGRTQREGGGIRQPRPLLKGASFKKGLPPMPKSLLASLLAALLAVTSVTATPARAADTGEIARFLVGAGALFIIGNAISNSNRHSHATRNTHKRVIVAPRRKVVPSTCLRFNRSDHGPRRYFGRNCLSRYMSSAHRLPSACVRTVYTREGRYSVFGARCLRNHGWVFG